MTQSCFSEVEEKNSKSSVRQLWLRTRKSKIQFDMKQYGFKPETRFDWSPVLGLSDVVATKQTLMRNSDSHRYIVFFKD